ncbi:MAG TPA: hypothetical protein VG985_04065 [Xanthobacteraceae bacterium]|nr:hypothetical protein [Xanthobacteraceae bacterium]
MHKTAILILAIGLVAVLVDAGPAAAQANSVANSDAAAQRRAQRTARTRIEVRPTRRFYRQCEAWLAPEARPSGTVITPQMRCRWAVR